MSTDLLNPLTVLTGTTVILNGTEGFQCDFDEKLYRLLKSDNRDVRLVDRLFDFPERIEKVAAYKPDNLVILTTGQNSEDISKLEGVFLSLGHLPKNVVFILGSTVDWFYPTMHQLKDRVDFYELMLMDMELLHIDLLWVAHSRR